VDDAQDVGLDGSAEAHCGLEVQQPLQQRAAFLVLAQANIDDAVEHVGAHTELERVDRAASLAVRRRGWQSGSQPCAAAARRRPRARKRATLGAIGDGLLLLRCEQEVVL